MTTFIYVILYLERTGKYYLFKYFINVKQRRKNQKKKRRNERRIHAVYK